jgi:uncharacterized protein YbjT (DUF2867 family)/quercetin dioxygenase-like cupin family protein
MANILVTGGTGDLGRAVVAHLLAHQHTPRVLSRQTHSNLPSGAETHFGDLTTGAGLREAVAGVDAIIHCASSPQRTRATDIGGTRLLVQAAHEAGSPHIVSVSIVGVDSSPAPYYQAKYEAEGIITQSRLPWSVVRATQFHSFALRLIQSLGSDRLNVIPVPPNVRLQTIATDDVAERLVALVEQGATNQVEEMGGPQVLTLEEMVQTYLRVRDREASLRAAELPNSLFAAFSANKNLSLAPARGKQTWEAFVRYWYRERDGYPVPQAQTPVLLEETVQVHDPVQVSVLTVTLEPGAQGSPPHRHPGPVFGYVVEGEVLFEMRGHAPRIYKQGEVFYEPYHCFHLLANNPNPFSRAVFVAILLGEPGQPILTPIPLQAGTNDPIDDCQSACS